MRPPRGIVALLTVAVAFVVSCTADPEPSGYCADLDELVRVLDAGGSVAEYEQRLARVGEESPPEHAPTWSLMLALSREPFSYDRFNPAVDSLDRIADDIVAICPGFDRTIVDDAGRMRRWPPE